MLVSRVTGVRSSAVRALLMSFRAYSRRVSRSDSVRPDGVVGVGVGGGLVRFRATMKTAAIPIAVTVIAANQMNSRLLRGDLVPRCRSSKFRLNVNS